MPAPDIDLVKVWCRIDDDRFDTILPTMIASASAVASHETGVDYSVEEMPESVQQWCAATVGYWISNPDAAIERRADPSPFLSGLLDPYRTWRCTPAP